MDYMTAKQLNEMNGEVAVYRLMSPMRYEDFKKMPLEIQEKYISGLIERFSVGLARISVDLFGCSMACLGNYLRAKDVKITDRKFRPTKEQKSEWNKWLGKEPMDEPTEETEPGQCEYPMTDQMEERKPAGMQFETVTCELEGEFDPESFITQLARLPIPNGKVKIEVRATRIQDCGCM